MASQKKPAPNDSKTTAEKSRATKTPGKKKAGVRTSKKSGRITIKNVAEAAGVSIATVSFVLNKRPGQVISEPVRKKVLEAARELNYAPSAAAATLARKQTANVAIVFYRNDHLITNQFYSFVVQGAIKEAAANEYNILFSFMHDEYKDYSDLPKVIREKNTEGVLFIHQVSEPLIKELDRMGIAAVGVDSHPFIESLNGVYVDNRKGGTLAAEHFIEHGHKNVVMLNARSDAISVEERRKGFLDTLKKNGLEASVRKAVVTAPRFDFQAGYQKCAELLKKRPEVTGIFAANDEMAAGALRAAHEAGRKVPEELSVIGFDDIIMSHYVDPPLTTIGSDKEGLGRLAMRRLLDLVAKKDTETRREILDVELVLRESTGDCS